MLANITPAADMSGGPWYTDNELDTVFIEQLCGALHRHIAQVVSAASPRRCLFCVARAS